MSTILYVVKGGMYSSTDKAVQSSEDPNEYIVPPGVVGPSFRGRLGVELFHRSDHAIEQATRNLAESTERRRTQQEQP